MRKRDWKSLYRTYVSRRDKLSDSGKLLKSELTMDDFIASYLSIEKEYRTQGYKSPTKNIIQNLTNSEIDYDFSFEQARRMRQQFRENPELGSTTFYSEKDGRSVQFSELKVSDIRSFRLKYGNDALKDIIKITYANMKNDPAYAEWFTGGKTQNARDEISRLFFGGKSK